MSGKAKKNTAPKAKKALDDEAPIEETEEQFVEETKPVERSKKADAPKKKASKRGFKLSSVDPIILASFTVFIVACLIVSGVTIYNSMSGASNESCAENGSKVQVNYTGSYFTWYNETGAVIFDTSMSNVGESSEYAKSYEYKTKETYAPISFTIGDSNYLSAFESAVIGLKPGETTTVKIVDGYGSLTQDVNKFTVNKVSTEDKILKVQNMSVSDYKTLFNTTDVPTKGFPIEMESPYGWPATIYYNSDGTITVENNPTEGETYTVNGVTVKNVSFSGTDADTEIDFDYEIADFEYNTKMLRTAYKDKVVYIIESSGTQMTYKTTDEKTGTTMYFTIEFVGYSS